MGRKHWTATIVTLCAPVTTVPFQPSVANVFLDSPLLVSNLRVFRLQETGSVVEIECVALVARLSQGYEEEACRITWRACC